MRLNNQYQTIKLHTLVGAWTILIGLLISSCDVHEFPKDKNIHLTLRPQTCPGRHSIQATSFKEL